jgi:hypothetical protein
MSEQPAVQLPWPLLQKLLNPLECFKTDKSYLLAPTATRTVVALFHALKELELPYHIDNRVINHASIQISSRGFKTIRFLDDERLAVGAGCEWGDICQRLDEQGLEVEGYRENLFSPKVSIEQLIFHSYLECLGAEMVSCQGGQLSWGSVFLTPALGPVGDSLGSMLQNHSALLTTVILKIKPLPVKRLHLLWALTSSQAGKEQWQQLQACSSSWEQLIYIESGHLHEKQFIFGQLGGWPEELENFLAICPKFLEPVTSPSWNQLKVYLRQCQLTSRLKSVDDKLKPGEYFWHEKERSWFLSPSSKKI